MDGRAGSPAEEHRRSPRLVRPISVAPPKDGLQDGDVRNYLVRTMSVEDASMLRTVRARCKSFTASPQWLSYLTEGGVPHLAAIDVRGLVNVVPLNGPGDKPNEYCISGFAIDNYSSLLAARQEQHPDWCRRSIFAKTTELTRLKLSTVGYALPAALPKHLSADVCQVLLPLFDEHVKHWLLLQLDLRDRCVRVFDSLPATKKKDKEEHDLLVHRAKTVATLAVMQCEMYTDAMTWEVAHTNCPRQDNGHDCDVFIMIFMDTLALTGRTTCFDQRDIRALRDKCLADMLRGRIRNFPMAIPFLQ